MSDDKEACPAHVQNATEDDLPAVLETSSPAARFELRQHNLTKIQAIKENKWPLIWCKSAYRHCGLKMSRMSNIYLNRHVHVLPLHHMGL